MSVRRAYKGLVVWIAGHEIYLVSPTVPAVWYPQADGTWRVRARCGGPHGAVPDPLCSCGIHATYDLIEALRFGGFIGLVRPVGRTIPAEDGWRAEAAVVELLAAPPEMISDLPEELRRRVCTYDLLEREASVPLRVEPIGEQASPAAVPSEDRQDPPNREMALSAVVERHGSFLRVTWADRRVVRRYRDGEPRAEWWYTLRKATWVLGRREGPAVIEYGPDGSPSKEVWYWDGRPHRDDGPAFVARAGGGTTRAWYRHGWCLRDEWKPGNDSGLRAGT
jgi:hypothetical protein